MLFIQMSFHYSSEKLLLPQCTNLKSKELEVVVYRFTTRIRMMGKVLFSLS